MIFRPSVPGRCHEAHLIRCPTQVGGQGACPPDPAGSMSDGGAPAALSRDKVQPSMGDAADVYQCPNQQT